MKKCMQCGGSTKMKKMAKGRPINKPMTYAKAQTGGNKLGSEFNILGGIPQYTSGTDGKFGKMKKGGSVKKMAKGGSLKPVPADKVGLAKLPTPVRNKMGYQKKGGVINTKKK